MPDEDSVYGEWFSKTKNTQRTEGITHTHAPHFEHKRHTLLESVGHAAANDATCASELKGAVSAHE